MTDAARAKLRRKIPIFATIFVALAVAAMIGLGVWQSNRAEEKRALLALYERNIAIERDIAYPETGPARDGMRFRRSGIVCLEVVGWEVTGGIGPDGGGAYRHIASCRTGAEGPGALVQAGTSEDPAREPRWTGGAVSGWIASEPLTGGWLERLTRRTPPPRPMLVADPALGGLDANAAPDPSIIPNNHVAYMWQWFFFAFIAAAIYALALRRRWRENDGKQGDV